MDIVRLKKVFDSIDENSCPGNINFHCHTTMSDGSMKPEQLIYEAISNNLKHLSVTDHHTIKAYSIIRNWLSDNKKDYNIQTTFWSGVEISAILNKCLVHVLGLGFDVDCHSLDKYLKGESVVGDDLNIINVIKAIHDSGGLAILAHPARYRIGYKELIYSAAEYGIDGAEAWYDYQHKTYWQPTPYICSDIDSLLKSKNLYSTCGTDSHGYTLLGR